MASEKDNKTMSTVGTLLMGFALADLISTIFTLTNPNTFANMTVTTNLDAATTNTLVGGVIVFVAVITIGFSLLQMYFGYRGYKLTPTKGIATFCLIIGILVLLGAISTLTSGNIFQGLFSACSGVVGILYYVYAKRVANF